jgi:hypothetical protein
LIRVGEPRRARQARSRRSSLRDQNIPDGESNTQDEAIGDVTGDVGNGNTQPDLLKAIQGMVLSDDDDEDEADHTPMKQSEDNTEEHA